MFSGFFYALREEGVPVSLYEWLTLMEALSKDLADNSLTDFYYLARCILIKSETDYDKYDNAFAKYFSEGSVLEKPASKSSVVYSGGYTAGYDPYDEYSNPKPKEDENKKVHPTEPDAVAKLLIKGQLEVKGAKSGQEGEGVKSSGGNRAVGDETGGSGGVSFGGGGGMTAIRVAGQRKYKDYQDDNIKNIRQFEMALRALRQLSTKQEGPKDELNIEATIEKTGSNAGMLSLCWDRPRKNTLKLIVLMDSIGSIYRYHEVCKRLFNAAHKSTHFKEISFYYFHNCIYGRIYKNQWLGESISTEEFFRLKNSDYRVLIVGDARMAVSELTQIGGVIDWSAESNKEPGLIWLKRVARHFPYTVWLNPIPEYLWGTAPDYVSISLVEEIFPMFELSPKGLEKAVKRLRSKIR